MSIIRKVINTNIYINTQTNITIYLLLSATYSKKEHVKGMKRYSDMSFFIRSRLDDAYRIMEQYSATGLYPVIGSAQLPSILSLDDKDVRRIILFTNNRLPEAEERLKKVKKKQSALDFLRDETMKKKLDKLISDLVLLFFYAPSETQSDKLRGQGAEPLAV